MFFKYGNIGGIQNVIDRVENDTQSYYNTLSELFKSCEEHSNLKAFIYAFDDRLNKHVFVILGDSFGFEQHFVCYFIED